jgi:hypothetical protein
MIHLPSEIRENIAVINGTPWGFGRFRTFSYDGLSTEEKLYRISQAYSFFKHAIKPGYTGCLWLVKREREWNQAFAKIKNRCPEENTEHISELQEAWLQTFEREGAQAQYEFIFAMELSSESFFRQKVASLLPVSSDSFQDRIASFTGVSLKGGKFEKFKSEFRERTVNFEIEELTADEVMSFYQRHNYRDMKKPDVRKGKKPSSLHFLMPNPIEDCGRYIRIDGSDECRLVTFITAAIYPDEIEAPGFDLLYHLQALGIPVEAQLWWKQKGHKEARYFAERKKKLAKSSNEHNSEINHFSLFDQEIQVQAEQLEQEISSAQESLNEVRLVFAVQAESEEELNFYVKTLEDFLERKGITPHRSAADQGAYYDAWLPHTRWQPMGYDFPMLPLRTAALSLPGAIDEVGDPEGLPKGIVLSNQSVFFLDFSYGARIDQTSNIVISGQSGSGKTHLADNITLDTLLMTYSRGLYMDLKEEHDHWDRAPGLKGKVQYKILDGHLNPGILDPFHLIQRVDDEEIGEGIDAEMHRLSKAKEIALDMILNMLGTQNQDFKQRNKILEALDAACDKGNPSMNSVIQILKESSHEEDREIGAYLERMQSLPLGALILGKPKEYQSLEFPQTGLIILGIKNLRLPEDGRPAVTISEKLSEVCMTGISVLVEQFLIEGKQKGVFSFFVGDEAYFYLKSKAGSQQIERNFRLGRSKFCGNIICTQNPSDIPGSLLNHVGVYICLGTKEDEETRQAMKALQVDPENIDIFEDLKNLGQAQSLSAVREKIEDRQFSVGYVRDLAGRVGRVKFITPQKHVREFLKTRPELYQPEKEESKEDKKVIRV